MFDFFAYDLRPEVLGELSLLARLVYDVERREELFRALDSDLLHDLLMKDRSRFLARSQEQSWDPLAPDLHQLLEQLLLVEFLFFVVHLFVGAHDHFCSCNRLLEF